MSAVEHANFLRGVVFESEEGVEELETGGAVDSIAPVRAGDGDGGNASACFGDLYCIWIWIRVGHLGGIVVIVIVAV